MYPSPLMRAPVLSALAACSALLGGCLAPHTSGPPGAQTGSRGASEPPAPGGAYVAPLVAPVTMTGTADIASLVERLRPTVVNVTSSHMTTADPHEGMMPFGGMFHGRPDGAPIEHRARALGSGFIVDPAGFVVTNAHVIAGADDIQVRLSDEREFPARVVGKDTKLDLALLRLDGASGLSAAVLGDSDGLRVGDWVVAIGNPFGLGHTVTLGITSAKDRTIGAGPYDAFIQTDASINPGNSGGPLFNLKGEVVGIPTAIRQGAQGIGFAVPVNDLKNILPQLRDKGVVTRGKLGVRIQHVTEELAEAFSLDRPRGALISGVEPGSSAARAGVVAGDIITEVEGVAVVHSEDLPRQVARHAPGTKMKFSLVRGGKPLQLEATLDPLIDDPEEGDEPGPAPGNRPPAPPAPQSRLGIQIDDAPGGGARIRIIAPASPAFGLLLPGDVLIEVNHQSVQNAAEAMKKTEDIPPGEVLLLRVKRGPDQRFVAIKLK